ncbi:MAG: protein phosphatase 2C domain-containing protein [Verrucomicrobiota bacterium]
MNPYRGDREKIDFERHTVKWNAITHPGHSRENNEDAFLALTFNSKRFHYLGKYGQAPIGKDDLVFAVSDGMGGACAGEYASKIAVEKISKLLPKGFRSRLLGMQTGFDDIFQELYGEIHKALSYIGASYEECAGMGSTLSMCWIVPEWMFFAHIGDTRIYYLPESAHNEIRQLSDDHTHVGWLFRNGKISEREARSHPRKNALQKALGAGNQFVEPQIGAVEIVEGDKFVLCSDGVIDGLWNRQILQLIRSPTVAETTKSPAHRLVDAALERSGKDNLTAVVLEIS